MIRRRSAGELAVRLRGFALAALGWGWATGSAAQVLPPPDGAGRVPEVRPALPDFRPPQPPALVLPPLPRIPDDGRLSGRLAVFVREIVVTGHSVISAAELEGLVAPYRGREVTADELQELRRRLTLYYVERGYINSGALLPDQAVQGGVVRFQVVEGGLGSIDIAPGGRLQPDYIADRIRQGAAVPLNLAQLQERLRILQQDRLIESINAELRPGSAPGESRLAVQVTEADPVEYGVGVNNQRSPSVGANRIEAYALHRNLGGRGDALEARYGLASGLRDYNLAYALPLNAHDTQVAVRVSASDARVVEAPFRPLDIRSKSGTGSLALTHPLWRSSVDLVTVGAGVERRASDTSLLGQPFSFSAGIPDGSSRSTSWRASLDWQRRTADEVIALRAAAVAGRTNAVGAGVAAAPDRAFSLWQVQLQWARRFSREGSQVLVRLDAQETGAALMSLDRLGIGGVGTVRGYRDNLLLRDRGQIASVEVRHPLSATDLAGNVLQVAAFLDHGRGTNRDRVADLPQSISGVGVALLWNPLPGMQLQLQYARALREVATPTRELADRGVHFSLAYRLR